MKFNYEYAAITKTNFYFSATWQRIPIPGKIASSKLDSGGSSMEYNYYANCIEMKI